jgi:EEF1A lysine methyltransferase 4
VKYLLCLKDVLFVDSGDPWDPNPENVSKVMKMLEGIHKVLKPDGVYISISFGQVKLTSFFFFLILYYIHFF